jgi:hypothetical protein
VRIQPVLVFAQSGINRPNDNSSVSGADDEASLVSGLSGGIFNLLIANKRTDLDENIY